MKLISWNVNGLRACLGKGFMDFWNSAHADAICIQETKMQPEQAVLELDGCTQHWNSAIKKGYSGTAIFTKLDAKSVSFGLGIPEHDQEGRVICADLGSYYLVTVYTPNSQRGLARLEYRMQWEDDFRQYIKALDAQKPVIICGDLNVAHQEIDLKNPKSNANNAGFTPQERQKMTLLLNSGFTDTFRHIHGDITGAYSWWSYMGEARAKNVGWRIDYFLVSDRIKDRVTAASIHSDIFGSDHCPVSIEIDL